VSCNYYYFNGVKIFTKGKYLNEERSKELLDIWNYQPIITQSTKSKVIKSVIFKDKFQASDWEL